LTKTAVSGIIKTLFGQILISVIVLTLFPNKGFIKIMKKNKKEVK
jgi:hypothetical protein